VRRISRAAARGRACHKTILGYGQSMPKRFHDYDRVAVVTGSDSGIGEAIAVALANAGFDIGATWNSGPQAGSHLQSDDWRNG
jgi:hypothetical protein